MVDEPGCAPVAADAVVAAGSAVVLLRALDSEDVAATAPADADESEAAVAELAAVVDVSAGSDRVSIGVVTGERSWLHSRRAPNRDWSATAHGVRASAA